MTLLNALLWAAVAAGAVVVLIAAPMLLWESLRDEWRRRHHEWGDL